MKAELEIVMLEDSVLTVSAEPACPDDCPCDFGCPTDFDQGEQ